MFKVAILGSENSHAWLFASKLAPREGKKLYDDVELIGIYGDPEDVEFRAGVEGVAQYSECPVYTDDPARFAGEADGVLVTARDGANHLKYSRRYIEKGIPVWIDKPFTSSIDDALELVSLAKEHNAPITGGSSLEFAPNILKLKKVFEECKDTCRGGLVSAPVEMESPYGGFWFYSQHLVAMMLTVFGYDVKAVRALKEDDGVHAVYYYDKFSVNAFFGGGYAVTVCRDMYTAEAENVILPADFFMPELEEFYNMLKTGRSGKTHEQLIAPVKVIDATQKSYTGGEKVYI